MTLSNEDEMYVLLVICIENIFLFVMQKKNIYNMLKGIDIDFNNNNLPLSEV